MLKVVYNACYGGFGLSDEAYILYAKLKGIDIYPEAYSPYVTIRWLTPPTGDKVLDERREYLSCNDIKRHDKVLIQVVEQLGNAASGYCADLKIEESDSNM